MGSSLVMAWTAGPPQYMSWGDVDVLSSPWFWIATATCAALVAVTNRRLTLVVLNLDVVVTFSLLLTGAPLPISIFLFSQAIIAGLRGNGLFLR